MLINKQPYDGIDVLLTIAKGPSSDSTSQVSLPASPKKARESKPAVKARGNRRMLGVIARAAVPVQKRAAATPAVKGGAAATTWSSLVKKGGWGDASITRLVASGQEPLEEASAITLGGLRYLDGGGREGVPTVDMARRMVVCGASVWKVYMPPGSAALITIPWVRD